MGRSVARVADPHVCPALVTAGIASTPIGAPGCLTVRVGGRPVARLGVDGAPCITGRCFLLPAPGPPPHVLVGGIPVAHWLDQTTYGGQVILGCGFVRM